MTDSAREAGYREPMSRTEAALYGTAAARAADCDARAITMAEAEAVAVLVEMKRDFERAYDETVARITTAIMECDRAIVAINASRAARGLPFLNG